VYVAVKKFINLFYALLKSVYKIRVIKSRISRIESWLIILRNDFFQSLNANWCSNLWQPCLIKKFRYIISAYKFIRRFVAKRDQKS